MGLYNPPVVLPFLTVTTGPILNASGTKAAPAYAFSASPSSGFYWRAGIAFGFAGNSGKEIIQISTTGNFYIASNIFGLNSVSGSDLSVTGSNVFLVANAAARIHHGGEDAASPVAQTVGTQGSRSGTDSNVGGANLTVTSGLGTGTGGVSTLFLSSPIAVASGTGAQTQTVGFAVKAGTGVLTNYTVAALPAAATAGAGATAYVTDATSTFLLTGGLPVTGGGSTKVPVYSDGTDWLVG